ncbi:MAG: hypothetical protein V4479_04545 [Actinomycetota bacterium]
MHKITVDGHEYFLDPERSLDETKNHVVDAVKSGGGLVDIPLAGHSTVSVLVSQSTAVTFETVDAGEPPSRGAEDDLWDWDYLLS